MSLDRLYQLDKSYAAQLEKLLHDVGYVEVLMGLQEDKLVELVNHLSDTINRLIRIGGPYRKCLHILRKISSTRGVLPSTYEVSGALLIPDGTPIAHGGFCDAKKGTLSTTREESVCVKTLRVYSSGDRARFKELLCREAIVWKYLTHPNIVPFKGVISEPPQLVSEWMSGGELRDYVENHPNANLLNLLVGVAEGLTYLHSCEVIHGDLKGPNILVDASGNARITDFGLASIARDPSSVASNSPDSGYTMRWTAPEIFHGTAIASKKADVFSFAMVMFEVFSGTVPFPDMAAQAVPAAIMGGQRPERPTHPDLTDPLWGLIKRCWGEVPGGRPEMEDVVKDLKKTEYTPPSRKPPGETRAMIQGISPTTTPGRKPIHKTSRQNVNGREETTTPYDVDTPLPGTTPPTPKVGEHTPLSRKGSKVVGREPVSRPPTVGNKDALAHGSRAAVEDGRVHRAPSKRGAEDKGHRELGRRKSRKGPEHETKDAEEAVKKAKVTPDRGQPDPSGSTTVLPQIILIPPSRPGTPKSPPNGDSHWNVPPVSGPSSHVAGENLSPPTEDPDSEPTIRPPATMENNQSESRPVKPTQAQPDHKKVVKSTDHPERRDQPTQVRSQGVYDAAHLSQMPPSAIAVEPFETPEVVPLKRPWWKCGCF